MTGRLVAYESPRALVVDALDAQEVEWELSSDPPLGCWVELEVVEGGRLPRVGSAAVHAPPKAGFPKAAGDWRAFHDEGQRRARALLARARVLRSIRAFFEARGSLEVETPLVVPSPGLDVHLAGFEVRGMGAPRWLITSPEYQMKRLLGAGFPRIHQIARCFRADERGARHEPEFTMLEWYRSFSSSDDLMRETEELVLDVATAIHGSPHAPVGGLGVEARIVDFTPPWERITVDEALRTCACCSLDEVLPDEERFFFVWSHEVEPRLGAERPVFVVDWPASMASLARLHTNRPAFADRFEAYVAGIELCNGFGELVDPVEQRTRLERDQRERSARGLPVYPIDERFLGALEEGLPPCAGNALGVDRLLALLINAPTLDDVMAFGSNRI